MNITEKARLISTFVDAHREQYIKMSDDIWEAAEVGFREEKSSAILTGALEEAGFSVETGVGGMSTAFVGTWGEGKPVVALLAEYDALPGLSQVAGLAEKKAVIPGGNGHGCGHNVLGAGAIAGAIAAKAFMEENGVPGTIKVFGCPAEESGWSKVFLARDGYFDGSDICFNWHPGGGNYVRSTCSSAVTGIVFTFHGKSSHAAATPHLGRSALDACELTSVGVNYLREHIIPEARVHYAYQDAGGKAPNVVQDHAVVKYFVRAPKVAQSREIAERVADVARGAALMTGTTVDVDFNGGMCDFLPNSEASRMLSEALMAIGAPDFDDDDRALARSFYETCSDKEIDAVIKRMKDFYDKPERFRGDVLIEEVVPFSHVHGRGAGSTDVGDVSYCMPTALLKLTAYANGTAGHSWQFAAQMATSIAHKSLIAAAKILALATVEAMESPERIEVARAEYISQTGGRYICPIGPDVKPVN